MTSPVIASASLGSSIFGGILSAKGKSDEYTSAAKQYDYQAGIALVNRDIALQNENYAYRAGESDALAYGLKAAKRAGEIKAGQGASGIDVGSESSVAVRKGQQEIAKLDLVTIRANAARTAYGYKADAVQYANQADLYKLAASDTRKAGKTAVLGSLVSTASSVSDKWLKGKTVGLYS